MTQELKDLREFILDGRYEAALGLIDELEEMSKKAILQNIASFLMRMVMHLIKNQLEARLTNSWAASIRDSTLKIQDLNRKGKKKAYYLKLDEWDDGLEAAFEDAIFAASVEVGNGKYNPFQLREMVDKDALIETARIFIEMTYLDSSQELRSAITVQLSQLTGGKNWREGKNY